MNMGLSPPVGHSFCILQYSGLLFRPMPRNPGAEAVEEARPGFVYTPARCLSFDFSFAYAQETAFMSEAGFFVHTPAYKKVNFPVGGPAILIMTFFACGRRF
jgi:hypothetical protein